MQRRITLRHLIILFTGLCLGCIIIGALAVTLRPRTFTTRVEAIGYVLGQRGISYKQIYVDRTWPDSVNSITYSADLILIVPNQDKVSGRIECKTMSDTCQIAFPKLGIDNTPIPELTKPQTIPLLTWLEARVAAIKAGKLPWAP